MKKGNFLAMVLLSSFFTQQIFAYSWEINKNNIEVVDSKIIYDDVFIDVEVWEVKTEETFIKEIELSQDKEVSEVSTNTWEVIQPILDDIVDWDWEIEIILDENIQVIEIVSSWAILHNEDFHLKWEDFNFLIKFQNPSYILEREIQKKIYTCDPKKEECKINITLTDESWDNLSSNYICEIQYTSEYETVNRCNPTTIILLENTDMIFSVFHKDNPEKVFIKNIEFIKNIPEDTLSSSWELKIISDDDIIEKNEYITWSGVIEENQINSWTWEIIWDKENSWTWNLEENSVLNDEINNSGSIVIENSDIIWLNDNLILPEIILSIQSWLVYSWTGNIYYCEKQDCKVNLDISDSFTWWFIESDFDCIWDFWSGFFSTSWTDKKCNPGYVNYGRGIHEISFQIISDIELDLFTWATWIIKNDVIENIVTETQDEGSIKSSWESWTWNSDSEGRILSWSLSNSDEIIEQEFIIPEININIQSGADYLNNETIRCNKENCKINLDASTIFSDNFPENKYECSWNFWSWSFKYLDTINKCNPWYVDYNLWNDEIIFQLSEKNNTENFITQLLFIQNDKNKTQSKSSSWWSNISKKSITASKDYGKVTEDKSIIIQLGLENNSCDSKECKINLKYENSTYESCIWDFGWIEVVDKYKETCNPGFIYAWAWTHKIDLKIYNSKLNKFYNKQLMFHNSHIENNEKKIKYFNIILQWKELDYKKYYNNKIVCLWVEKCNINLNIETNTINNLEYFWDFWNWNKSESRNPKSVWYSSWSYELNLTIIWENILETKKIKIEVIWKNISEKQVNILTEIDHVIEKEKSIFTQMEKLSFQNIKFWFNRSNIDIRETTKGLILHSINNNWWFESKDKGIKKLKLTRNISKQKKSLKYSGITFPNSNIFILQWDDIIEIISDNTWKYSQKFTNIKEWKYSLEYYILDSDGNLFENKKEKLLTLSHKYVLDVTKKNLKIVNNKEKKSSSKNTNNIKKKYINNIQYAWIITEIHNKTTRWEFIFQLSLLLLSIIWWSILLKRYKIL
jgi:hypothetical protein